jgi:hypothetical protein
MVPRESLLVGRPKGILDVPTAERIIEFVEIKELESETGFNRFCDLTNLLEIRLSPSEILQLAVRRGTFNPNDIHVKSAFFAIDESGLGIAREFARLLNSPRIEVRVWSNLQAAADWLGVQRERLAH